MPSHMLRKTFWASTIWTSANLCPLSSPPQTTIIRRFSPTIVFIISVPLSLSLPLLLSYLSPKSPNFRFQSSLTRSFSHHLLSAGASPAMVHSVVEVPDFTPHVQALCVNVGTLTPDWLPSMKAAAELASQLRKPLVLDPAAVSCSGFRLKACLELVGLKPTVIKGNGSEIIALSSASPDVIDAAKSLARSSGSVVAVSGAVDIVTDGTQVIGVHNGTKMMQKITATGCSLAGLIAALLAINPSRPLEATVSATSVFGIAGELGEAMAKGPASLRMHLIDSLCGLDESTVLSRVNVTRLG